MKTTYRIECRGDEELAVHKVSPEPGRWGGILLPSFYSLTFAVMCFSAPFTAEVPMSRPQVALSWSGGLALVVAGPAIGYLAYLRSTFGTWLIDGRAIEFLPLRGTRCRIEWKDVRRVRWSSGGFTVLGDVGRIALNGSGLVPEDWDVVRGRVELLLSGRFDLAIRSMSPQKFRLSRVLAVAAPLTLLTALLSLAMPALPRLVQALVIFAYLFVMLGAIRFCWLQTEQEYERLNPRWRSPKSKADDLEDWSL